MNDTNRRGLPRKTWSCHCQMIRTRNKSLFAFCPRCKADFLLGDNRLFSWRRAPMPGEHPSFRPVI